MADSRGARLCGKAFPRRTGGFPWHTPCRLPRLTPLRWNGSRGELADSRGSPLGGRTAPAENWQIPAARPSVVERLPRRTGGFPRPTPLRQNGSRGELADSCGPPLCGRTFPAANWRIPAAHPCAAERFPQRTGGFPRLRGKGFNRKMGSASKVRNHRKREKKLDTSRLGSHRNLPLILSLAAAASLYSTSRCIFPLVFVLIVSFHCLLDTGLWSFILGVSRWARALS